ncbi:unnamed protein product [Rhizophagus irregularis]|nr:unnamed protein product [Rhizophagus irregularis]
MISTTSYLELFLKETSLAFLIYFLGTPDLPKEHSGRQTQFFRGISDILFFKKISFGVSNTPFLLFLKTLDTLKVQKIFFFLFYEYDLEAFLEILDFLELSW